MGLSGQFLMDLLRLRCHRKLCLPKNRKSWVSHSRLELYHEFVTHLLIYHKKKQNKKTLQYFVVELRDHSRIWRMGRLFLERGLMLSGRFLGSLLFLLTLGLGCQMLTSLMRWYSPAEWTVPFQSVGLGGSRKY